MQGEARNRSGLHNAFSFWQTASWTAPLLFSPIIPHSKPGDNCAEYLPVPSTGFPLGLDFALVRHSVYDLIFPLVHVQQNIQLIQPGRFFFQFLLSGEGLFYLLLGNLHLDFQVFQLLLVVQLPCGHTFQKVIHTLNVAEHIRSKTNFVGQRTMHGNFEQLFKAVKAECQLQSSVRTKGDRVGTGQGIAGLQDCRSGSFLFGVGLAAYHHRAEPIRVWLGFVFQQGHVRFQTVDPLVHGSDLLGEFPNKLIFQGVPLTHVSLAYHSFIIFKNGAKSLSEALLLSILLFIARKRTSFCGNRTSV